MLSKQAITVSIFVFLKVFLKQSIHIATYQNILYLMFQVLIHCILLKPISIMN